MIPIIRPATEKDLEGFGKKFDKSTFGYVVEYNGEVAAIAIRTLEKEHSVLMSSIKENVKAPKTLIFKTALRVLSMIVKKDMPIYAIRECNFPNSGKFLERLGFYQIGDSRVYKYEVLI